jgi:hypothetical protein
MMACIFSKRSPEMASAPAARLHKPVGRTSYRPLAHNRGFEKFVAIALFIGQTKF